MRAPYTQPEVDELIRLTQDGEGVSGVDAERLRVTVQALTDYKRSFEHFMDRASAYEQRMAKARKLIAKADVELQRRLPIGDRLHDARKLLDGRRTRYVYKGERA